MFRDWLLSPVVSFYSFSSPFDGNSRLNLNPGFRCIALFGTVITANWPVGTCITKLSESFNYCKNILYGEGHRSSRTMLHSARLYPKSSVIRHAGNSEGKCRNHLQFIQASRNHLEAWAPSATATPEVLSQVLKMVQVSRITNCNNSLTAGPHTNLPPAISSPPTPREPTVGPMII